MDSGGKSCKIALAADFAAVRTTSPLSAYKSNRMGREGSSRGAAGAPRIEASDWKAIAADSRSYPDFLFVE